MSCPSSPARTKTCSRSTRSSEQGLILFVTLNMNKNTEPVRALGKMLLQNLQLDCRKALRERRRAPTHRARPLFSVVLDEFAPFGYRNFRANPANRPRNEYGLSVFHAKSAATDAVSAVVSRKMSVPLPTRP